MPNIHLIWAEAHRKVIGHKGVMPWHLPEDLAHFKRTTHGHPVIMGRKTWDSLPPRFKPLPERTNIVVTRQANWLKNSTAPQLQAYTSLEAALASQSDQPEVWIMGGAQIYAQALPLADRVVMTQIDAEFAGDAFAPELSSDWMQVSRDAHRAANGLNFAFVTYVRANKHNTF